MTTSTTPVTETMIQPRNVPNRTLGQRWVEGWRLIFYTWILSVFAFLPARTMIEFAEAYREDYTVKVPLRLLALAYVLGVSPFAFRWAAAKAGYDFREPRRGRGGNRTDESAN